MDARQGREPVSGRFAHNVAGLARDGQPGTLSGWENVMRCTLVVAIVVGTLWSASASAQTAQDPFQQLREAGQLKTGDSFVVKRPDGTRVTGELQEVVPGKLRLRVRGNLLELSEAEVDRIERRDSAADGALLGALAGVAAATAYTKTVCGHDNPECTANVGVGLGGPMVLGGGVVGYLVDRAMRRVVFDAAAARAPRITMSPVVSRHHRGAALSIAW